MKRLLISILLSTFACNCEETQIYKVCPQNQPCYIEDGKIIVNYKETYGECKLGQVVCDGEEIVECFGYIGPTIELCNKKDDNCNNKIDEGFDKDQDGFTSCGGDCDDDNFSVNPSVLELCNNINDNCQNGADENIPPIECWTGPNDVIFNETSSCQKGKQYCINGGISECIEQVFPSEEICDLWDNNCNGLIDEPAENACGPIDEIGQCKKGNIICIDKDPYCVEAVYPQNETCNGLDDSCDGVIDENLFQPCSTICEFGYERCDNGIWQNCTAREPSIEICDEIDNDCDGLIDEDCACNPGDIRACIDNIIDIQTGNNVYCGIGTQICLTNFEWDQCYFFNIFDEICNNWDDDCVNGVDNITEKCGNIPLDNIGECRTGTKTCSNGIWSECIGEVNPVEEICNQKDDNCNLYIDEDLNGHTKADLVFAIDDSGSMCPYIDAIRNALASYVIDFTGTEHRFALIRFPGLMSNQSPGVLVIPLSDVNSFISALSQIDCDGWFTEPNYDIVYHLSDPFDVFHINWREDAQPYIILLSDEMAQTLIGLTETDVASKTNSCSIGVCINDPNAILELYVFTTRKFFEQWDSIVNYDNNRLININPADTQRYVDILRDIFTDVCL